ncbi:alpha/beta fold hydrolase [Sphingomonas sp. S2-65]|uniref:alpha/beta fold hydrolase n=1 Tax=Sphingomonas sp. S2-65 TaxID=2903960 RepID=UPI001F38507E|nr:alpha/beta hydrolase [Sphingomonas sp. S2-65]UYY58250.1 alpha/beta hydrolase [Sphingomonas sp. S2-65]
MTRFFRTIACRRGGRLPLFAILVAIWAANGSPGVGAPILPAQQAAASAPTGLIQMDHISVQIVGKGSPVILIPGLSSPRAAWEGVTPELARNHTVYLVQVNGFGGDDPRANLRPGILDGIVADLRTLIAERKLRKPAVVGHSMGGLAGMMLAARHPESVGKLMVVDALPFFSVMMAPPGSEVSVAMVEPRAAQMRDAVAAGYGKAPDPAAAEANVAGLTRKPERSLAKMKAWAMAADPRVSAQAMYEDLTTDMRPELTRIRAPLTIAYAWNDVYPRGAQAEAFFRAQYAGAAGARFVAIGDSGHFIMLDQPEAFARALAAFAG